MFFLLSLIFEKVQLQFLKLLKSSAKFLVKKQSGRVPLQLIGKKKSKMNSLQVEMHALLQFSIIAENAESLTGKLDFSTDGEAARYLVTEASFFVVYVKNKVILC